jgi:hypothetical protein
MNSKAIFSSIEENISRELKLYWGNNRLVIERNYGPWFKRPSVIFVFLIPMLLSILIIVLEVLLLGELNLKSFFLSFLLVVSFYFMVRRLIDAKRVILDMNRKTVRIEEEKKGKVKSEREFPISAIKNILVYVDSYYKMSVYLDSNFESIRIISDEVSENKKKLEIAHKIAGLLEVPVIEKT